MIIKKETQEQLLANYFADDKNNIDKCEGFVDGMNAALKMIDNLMKQQKERDEMLKQIK